MDSFPNFFGNRQVAQTLSGMLKTQRISQTILLTGPEGVGKATLARRFGAALLSGAEKIEQDDLSLPHNQEMQEQRDKWPAEKRSDDPLLFSTHPDFVTFAPDGPLRQITIHQMRQLRERAQFKPLLGNYRVFLIDRLDRANEQAANSLLKILEEPPPHLVIFATAENLYDLLPTIRSRSVVMQMSRLPLEEMLAFVKARALPDGAARAAVAEGCPGIAATLDLQVFRERRALMLAALRCGAGLTTFADWLQSSESFANRKSEKLDLYLKPAYSLLEEVIAAMQGKPAQRSAEIQTAISEISGRVTLDWLELATKSIDELAQMVRRNIQKLGALDAMVVNLRNNWAASRT